MTRRDRRRLLLAAAALLLLPAARSQAAERVYRVVYLTLYPPRAQDAYTEHLKHALRDLGYIEGRNLTFERRHAGGQSELLPGLARDIVNSRPDVIVTGVNAFTRVAQQATRTIPIVMVVGTDVVKEGFVASLSRPGGNITGLTWDAGLGVFSKRVEYLAELMPKLARVAVLWDQGQDATAMRGALERFGETRGWSVLWLDFREDLELLLEEAARQGAQALITGGGTRLLRQREKIAELTTRYRLPSAHYDSAFVDAGGLMSYAPSLQGLFKRSAKYVDRILRGANPADLPVEQPTQFDLVINLKTAGTLGITVPQSLLLRADRLVQ